MTWDPFGTLAATRWLGGGQWAGKSTVSRIIADRCGITAYHFDYPSARAHTERAALRAGRPIEPMTAEHMYVDLTPEESAAEAVTILAEHFEYALDDLRALFSGRPILAEGWAFRPDLLAPIIGSKRRMLIMVPTDGFRLYQSTHLERATRPHQPVSDLARAQRNRIERDRLVAAGAVQQARRHDIRVLEIDGSIDEDAVADIVIDHFELEGQ